MPRNGVLTQEVAVTLLAFRQIAPGASVRLWQTNRALRAAPACLGPIEEAEMRRQVRGRPRGPSLVPAVGARGRGDRALARSRRCCIRAKPNRGGAQGRFAAEAVRQDTPELPRSGKVLRS